MEYKVTITNNDRTREIYRHQTEVNTYGLMRMLEKCEIKKFTVELE